MKTLIAPHLPAVNRIIVLRAAFCMILSSLCFALVEFTGAHLVYGVSPFQIVWTRYAVHLLFMVVVLGPRYKTTLVRTSQLPLQIVRSLTMLAMPLLFIASAMLMPVHDVWSLQWTSPLIMLALSTWVMHEPATTRQWVATGLGFVGMLLALRADGGVFSPFAILAIATGACWSLHLMFSRMLWADHPVTSLFHTALWVFILLGFAMPFVWSTPSALSLVGMTLIGLIGALALFALARSGELVPLPVVAAFGYIEAFWTLLLNALFFGALPGKRAIAGVVLILGVSLFQLIAEYRRHPDSPILQQHPVRP
jgi:drug/metabolite transporter (DMT)-like permease